MLLQGDCKNELKKIEKNSVDLVYLDPPFFSQRTHKLKNKDNSKEYLFEDNWASSLEYKEYIKERLLVCREVLKNTGSIFLHCDKSASHYLRIALDEVFGSNNFQSEIIWSYKRWSNSKKGLLNSHQVIFFYSKTDAFKFNQIYTDYSPTTNIDQIFQKRKKDINGKTVYKTCDKGVPEIINEKKGVPLSDVWEIPYLNPKAKERVGYPTQKPILLLEQIIKLVTEEGDTVLDPFCGSGTTLVASKLLNRGFIGIDQSKDAIELSKQRLKAPVKTESALLRKGKKSYINQSPEILNIIKELNAVPVQRNKGIDAFLKTKKAFKPIPIRIQRENEPLELALKSLITASKRNTYTKKVLIRNINNSEPEGLFGKDDYSKIKDLIIFNGISDYKSKRDNLLDLT